ncbi:DUF551 domain-containing protein [Salmonella enterica subsp. enterica serovar Newport]|uniref:DUF551 domain-containing protein n=1 Tax=Salmonella newport TaxID=108619 RepID=A0A5Y2FH58_SALNE|nr:DUF551 domain-containing protein [Salmonella enterica subsp. enterica serovar Newport]EBY5876599.1 DUF551 domain-containing protein [Salmonella enterica subsp. enterica serovar Newport]ECD6072818.1 DUF551 domain-containing protein [Salmonella enterica subsp. enterica serovar Newport]ECG5024719.1 DUF551 domain-containing protein [Salmonella enterica subsp. enterica serovar Newport]ECH1284086.1 DUF551 domain-containing protein [Salmonella enterica subsp. enterica serovar Newport]
MTTITKERLLKIQHWRETYGAGSNVMLPAEEAEELASIALAALTAEPVAWECGENIILFNPDTVEAYAKRAEISPKPLYAAPPAPVVPEEAYSDDCPDLYASQPEAWAAGWNACRTALLQGAEPVSHTYKLNELSGNSPVTQDGWISCSERMPDNDESKPIAIFTGKCLGQGMFVATYDDDGFFDYWEGMEIIGVTHWMPLPAPPQQ